MTALILCVIAFLSSLLVARRSLAYGLIAVAAWGYAYGILRANLLTAASHFIFDAGLLGLYCGQLAQCFHRADSPRIGQLRLWLALLVIWPLLICCAPFQPLLVSIVGFRGAAFFLPVALLGARLASKDLTKLAFGLAALNLIALAFATAEYFQGIERYYPISPVTYIVYASGDVAGNTAYRLPGTFVTAHAFAGTVVSTLPFLFGAWTLEQSRWLRQFLLFGMGAAILGMLMAATRVHFLVTLVLVAVATLTGQFGAKRRVIWMLMIIALAIAAFRNERFQRFKTLADTDMVSERVAGSVNQTFWEILIDYPFGNGMGGGGTSMPYFLMNQVQKPVGLESEYSRILVEQGIIGLLFWIAFIAWFLSRRTAFVPGPWVAGRRLAWVACVCYFVTGMLGTGMLTSIPQTLLLALSLGWAAAPPASEFAIRRDMLPDRRSFSRAIAPLYAK
jgi:hypothetical protein